MKITLPRVGESWGEPGRRTHCQDSEMVAERRCGLVTVSIKQGAVNSYLPDQSSPEKVACIVLSDEQVRALAAFLSSLKLEV